MKHGFFDEHWCDDHGYPVGGISSGRGFTISWQNGPLGRGQARRAPNGAFVEDVIQAVRQRIEFYQHVSGARFACDENQQAIEYLRMAENVLNMRTQEREARQVEGTYNV
jgi:hypothetical protein